MYVFALVQFAAVISAAAAVPIGDSTDVSSRTIVGRDCSAEISALDTLRRRKRGLAKRSLYPGLANTTCILSPNVPLDQNWVSGAPVQYNVTGGQEGIALTLDVGVMDITTCQPISNALVEIWSPNAVGTYGDFLRGAQPSSSAGIAEIQTIFPGYTSTAANHISIIVHSTYSGGTTATATSASHIGTLYFTDRWTDVITMDAPYNANTNTRMLNAQDPVYAQANSAGFSAVLNIEEIGDDWPAGISGYITVGVNPHSSVTLT